MNWIQVSFRSPASQAAKIEARLERMGAVAITLGEAGDTQILEPAPGDSPLWDLIHITALFDSPNSVSKLRRRIRRQLPEASLADLRVEQVEDRDWQRLCLDAFQPMAFGRRLWVCPEGKGPAWEEAIVVDLDPGLAFGTGSHPTTALCLEWLDQAELTGKQLLDYGCGSGILAIAALKLGAREVVAVDHDPQALEATDYNARRNAVRDSLRLCHPAMIPSATRVDLVIANILAATLIELKPSLLELLKPGGQLILSGILADQAPEVEAAFLPDVRFHTSHEREGWVRLDGVREAS